MASSDVRDVLNLPGSVAGGPRPSKKPRLSQPRPNLKGLAREVHNLGGDNPIAIVPEVTQFKKRRLANRKPAARWELRQFRNSGRDDQSLILRHWRRKEDKVDDANADAHMAGDGNAEDGKAPKDEIEDSAFAKYNVRIPIPEYTADQYRSTLQHDDWSKEETDYLMQIARDFDLRWPIMWDRYEWNPPATNGEANADGDESKAVVPATKSRTMEDLKARYYEVAAKMMAIQKPVQGMSQQEYALYELMAHFNPQQERLRKEFASNTLSRSREEAREEESLLLEIKRILARSERMNEDRRELYNRLDYPHSETDINSFKSSAGLQTLLQNLMSVDKSKKRKSLMGSDGTNTPAAGPLAAAPESGKRDSNAGGAAATRESTTVATATPTGNKKGQQQQQQQAERRKLSAQEEAIYGVTHHDRLGSGATFRTEKINKLFSHKSHQQQLRINNVLNELDVPSRLAMPTAKTTQQYELLLGAVNGLLDARKVFDKLEAELKLEQAKKAEREKALEPSEEPSAADGELTVDAEAKTGTEANHENPDQAEAAAKKQEDGAVQSEAAEETINAGGGEPAALAADNAAPEDDAVDEDKAAEAETADGNAQAEASAEPASKRAEEADEAKQEQTAATTTTTKDADEATDRGKRERSLRPGSSGPNHKRSASVLSTVSDKSSKRQKK